MSSGDDVRAHPFPGIAVELRAALNQRGMTIRELGRQFDPDNPERGRRSVSRWLAGTIPTPRNARRVAVLLEQDPETFVRRRADAVVLLAELEARVARLEAELQERRRGGRAMSDGGE